MIGRVVNSGDNVTGVLHYLFGKGRRNEHVNPHLAGGWEHPASHEPPVGKSGKRDFRRLAGLLEQPVAALGDRAPARYVWHCVLRAAPEDPELGDGAWMDITARLMDRIGLSKDGHEQDGIRWVAVHHGDQHVHIVGTLARQDGGRADVNNLYWKIGAALTDIEKEYGLRQLVRDKTADKAPTQAEMAKARAAGQTETARAVLRRIVQAAAAASRTEADFFAAVEARGALARPRYSTTRPGEVTGYSVALPGDAGPGGRPVWYGGGRLASDLTLPKLRARWAGPRLSGRGMAARPGRAVVACEALRAARAARSEGAFFALLDAYGLQVRLRPDPARPGRPAGYCVTLPGLADDAGRPVWYGGRVIGLPLGELRARWRAGRPGAAPGPDYFTGAARAEIYEHAARAAELAARDLAAGGPGRADTAWAAADVLTAAAGTTGSPDLARAAEELTRAARAAWGRVPAPSPLGAMLRTAAYLISSCERSRRPQPARAFRDMLLAIASLARTLAELRAARDRHQQAAASAASAARLAAVAAQIDRAMTAVGLAATSFPHSPRPGKPTPTAGTPGAREAPKSQPQLRMTGR